MKYSEWSKQYSDDAEKIRDRINELINELKTQQETAPPSELGSINNRISILISMYHDCMETAAELMRKARRKDVEFGS